MSLLGNPPPKAGEAIIYQLCPDAKNLIEIPDHARLFRIILISSNNIQILHALAQSKSNIIYCLG